MSIQTLKKQFQKELKANPKKAAVLGLLAVVAIYFWVPLAMKMVTGKKGSKSNKVAQSQIEPTELAAESNPDTTTKRTNRNPEVTATPTYSWDQVLDWIKQDPLTVSNPELKNPHDPFKRVEKIIEVPTTEQTVASQEAELVPEVVRDLSPQALGMKLTSTIVGNQRSSAIIDDRPYALGQPVKAYDGATQLRFRLVEIRPELVILERDDQQYALRISQSIGLTVEETEGL